LRSKNFYGAYGITTFWNKNGNFVAFKVNSIIKKKEEVSIEIISTKEKSFPVSSISLKDEIIVELEWESKGKRFSLLSGDGNKCKISFYEMKKKLTKFDNHFK